MPMPRSSTKNRDTTHPNKIDNMVLTSTFNNTIKFPPLSNHYNKYGALTTTHDIHMHCLRLISNADSFTHIPTPHK